MITLTFEEKQSLGFQFLLDEMQPNCIYGQERIKNAAPYGREQKEELEEELIRLGILVEQYEKERQFWNGLELVLMQMKEVRGSLKRGRELVLTDLELFELKHFLLQSEKLYRYWNAPSPGTAKRPSEEGLSNPEEEERKNQEEECLPEEGRKNQEEERLPGIRLADTSKALDILDPQKRRLPGFYIADEYAEDLKAVRERKRHLEVVLRQEHAPEAKEALLHKRQEQVDKEEEIQQRIREELTEQLRPWLDAVWANCETVGRLDFLLQKAKLALRYGGIRPQLTNQEMKLIEMSHPAIRGRLLEKGKEFTPISFEMGPGAAVITGANMGGKSVALRTIALNVVLAQSGFFVYAKEARLPLFDHICLVAEEYQSMQNGLSSFGGEMIRLQHALDAQKQGFSLLIFDELARGTNPDEGAAIVRAAVKYLGQKQTMAILATHYDHVAEYADYHYQVTGLKNVDLRQLEAEIHSSETKKGIDIIAKHMNYGIYQVHGKEECPRDAIHICGLLGLEPALMALIEEDV